MHFSKMHAGDTTAFTFLGIEQVLKPIRGGIKKLFSRESRRIYELGTHTPEELYLKQDICYQY